MLLLDLPAVCSRGCRRAGAHNRVKLQASLRTQAWLATTLAQLDAESDLINQEVQGCWRAVPAGPPFKDWRLAALAKSMRPSKLARRLILVLGLSLAAPILRKRSSETETESRAAMEPSSRYVEVQGIRTRVLEVPGNTEASGEQRRRRRHASARAAAAARRLPAHLRVIATFPQPSV